MARLGCLLGAAILAHGSNAVGSSNTWTHAVVHQTISYLTPTHGSLIDTDFLRLRRQVGTQLTSLGPAPELYKDPTPSEGVRIGMYLSAGNELKAWQQLPHHKQLWTERGYPAVIYVHDGTTLNDEEMAHAKHFSDAGFWVVVPTFRGENGNGGAHELLFGELEDLVAVAHYTRALPDVDATRIAIFGHGTGGMLSALASLVPELPVHCSVSSAGLRPESAFEVLQGPFVDSRHERHLRLFGPNINHMHSPHMACVAEQDPAVYAEANRLRAIARDSDLPLEVTHVKGSRSASREECQAKAISYLAQSAFTQQ